MTSTNKPDLVDKYYERGLPQYYINFNVVQVDFDTWEHDQVRITSDKWNYGGIVDVLIQFYYPNDKMQSVINNYLLEPDNVEFIKDFQDMQEWRKEAKKIAKEALEYELH